MVQLFRASNSESESWEIFRLVLGDNYVKNKLKSVALVRERTIPNEPVLNSWPGA
jgi:hypothetical protein